MAETTRIIDDLDPPWEEAGDLERPDDAPEDYCIHEDASYDILTGRAECYRCGESWYPNERESRFLRHG